MKQKNDDKKYAGHKPELEDKANKEEEGYPEYPASEDIYNRSKNLQDINPEDLAHKKVVNEDDKNGVNNEKDFYDDKSGGDLDVPGSELDDNDENIGSEDEENNYYSIGGDEHNNLDEDKGN